MFDVAIAGAGPAGSVAAHQLARAGRHVLLLDPLEVRSSKIGDALPSAGVALLRRIGLRMPVWCRAHTAIGGNISVWGSREAVARDFINEPGGTGWRLDRAAFEADLLDAALTAGARFRATNAAGVARADDGWRIDLGDGDSATARWLIDATGRPARLARRLGARRRRDPRLIAMYGRSVDGAELRFDRTVIEATPSGWWYAGRMRGDVLVAGFHTRPSHARILIAHPQTWRSALEQTSFLGPLLSSLAFDEVTAIDAGGSCLSAMTGDGWVACGDAALSFDPVSGQGLLAAMHGATLAAKAVDAALGGDKSSLRAYETRLHDIRQRYVAHCCAAYASEPRWEDNPFWSSGRTASNYAPTTP